MRLNQVKVGSVDLVVSERFYTTLGLRLIVKDEHLEASGSRAVTRLVVESPMTETVDTLILDLLEWLGTERPRPYHEVLDAWRTSCPRLPVWEEANSRGFIERGGGPGTEQTVWLSQAGVDYLRTYRLQPVAP